MNLSIFLLQLRRNAKSAESSVGPNGKLFIAKNLRRYAAMVINEKIDFAKAGYKFSDYRNVKQFWQQLQLGYLLARIGA